MKSRIASCLALTLIVAFGGATVEARARVSSSQAARMKSQFKPQPRPSLNRGQVGSQNKFKPAAPGLSSLGKNLQTKPRFKPQPIPGKKPQPRPQLKPGKKPQFKPSLQPQRKPNLHLLGFPQFKPSLNAIGGKGKQAAYGQAKNDKKAALGLLLEPGKL